MASYICIGSVRGDCGHRHRSIEAARECCDRDRRACELQGAYSDCRVYSHDEWDAAGRPASSVLRERGIMPIEED